MTISRNVKTGIIVLIIGLIALMVYEKWSRKNETFNMKHTNTWLHIKCCHQNGENNISMVHHS
jgi:hypothetical protein